MVALSALYFLHKTGSTYEAYDSAGSLSYSGTSLVTDVLNQIEAAHSSGGFGVLFGAYDFNMGTENWTLNGVNNVLLAGQGMGVTHVQNSNSTGSDSEPFSFTNCDRITIRDMDVTAGGTNNTTSDAIDFDNSDYCIVERVRILGSRSRGIVFDGKDAGAQAIGNIVRDCYITGTQGVAGDGIELLGAERCLIQGNYIDGASEQGIDVTKASATAGKPNHPSNHNRIIGNVVIGSGQHGIRVHSSSWNVVEGNQVLNSFQTTSGSGIRLEISDAITADDNVIVGNVSTDNQGTKTQRYGVDIASASCNRTLVSSNNLSGNDVGSLNDLGTGTVSTGNVT